MSEANSTLELAQGIVDKQRALEEQQQLDEQLARAEVWVGQEGREQPATSDELMTSFNDFKAFYNQQPESAAAVPSYEEDPQAFNDRDNAVYEESLQATKTKRLKKAEVETQLADAREAGDVTKELELTNKYNAQIDHRGIKVSLEAAKKDLEADPTSEKKQQVAAEFERLFERAEKRFVTKELDKAKDLSMFKLAKKVGEAFGEDEKRLATSLEKVMNRKLDNDYMKSFAQRYPDLTAEEVAEAKEQMELRLLTTSYNAMDALLTAKEAAEESQVANTEANKPKFEDYGIAYRIVSAERTGDKEGLRIAYEELKEKCPEYFTDENVRAHADKEMDRIRTRLANLDQELKAKKEAEEAQPEAESEVVMALPAHTGDDKAVDSPSETPEVSEADHQPAGEPNEAVGNWASGKNNGGDKEVIDADVVEEIPEGEFEGNDAPLFEGEQEDDVEAEPRKRSLRNLGRAILNLPATLHTRIMNRERDEDKEGWSRNKKLAVGAGIVAVGAVAAGLYLNRYGLHFPWNSGGNGDSRRAAEEAANNKAAKGIGEALGKAAEQAPDGGEAAKGAAETTSAKTAEVAKDIYEILREKGVKPSEARETAWEIAKRPGDFGRWVPWQNGYFEAYPNTTAEAFQQSTNHYFQLAHQQELDALAKALS